MYRQLLWAAEELTRAVCVRDDPELQISAAKASDVRCRCAFVCLVELMCDERTTLSTAYPALKAAA
jgi:hypothetical protein